MTLPSYPTDDWGKDEYWEDVERYRKSMVRANRMNLSRKQRGCCRNINNANAESISILENSGQRLSRAEKQRLYELADLRFGNFCTIFIPG